MTYSQEQIRIGKLLVKWMLNQGITHQQAREEVVQLMEIHGEKKLWSAMQKVGVTSLNALKKTLLQQNMYKSEKILNRKTPLTVYPQQDE